MSNEVTMSIGWRNMNDNNQCFFYQLELSYGVESNDTGLGNDNDENMGGDAIDMQPNNPHFFSYFMIDGVYFMTFICPCFVKMISLYTLQHNQTFIV